MRKIVGPILIGLGAFLLVVAVLAVAYAPGEVKRTPLGVNSTTKLEGQADRLEAGTRPIYALSITKSDDSVSTDDVVVFTNIACAVFDEGQERACADGDDENALSLSTDVFATDRVTAEAVDVDALPDDAEPHEGLVNKWPFDAKQETYPYWDGVTGSAQDAVFEREDEVDGLDVYVYRIEISNAPIEIADGVDGTYTSVKEIYVDPRTGAIIHQTEEQQRYLEDGSPALDLQLAFTDEQQAENVADAEDNIASLDLLTKTVPLVGFIGGGLLLLVGLFLVVSGRRNGRRAATS
jgi:hypothetical protein